jgi:hypothetical protein
MTHAYTHKGKRCDMMIPFSVTWYHLSSLHVPSTSPSSQDLQKTHSARFRSHFRIFFNTFHDLKAVESMHAHWNPAKNASPDKFFLLYQIFAVSPSSAPRRDGLQELMDWGCQSATFLSVSGVAWVVLGTVVHNGTVVALLYATHIEENLLRQGAPSWTHRGPSKWVTFSAKSEPTTATLPPIATIPPICQDSWISYRSRLMRRRVVWRSEKAFCTKEGLLR